MIDLTPIIEAAILLIAAIVTYKVIPWIKARTTNEQQAFVKATVKTLVFAAEQIYGAGTGKEKLDYVENALKERGFKVDRAEIEAAVKQSFGVNLVMQEEVTEDIDVEMNVDDWPLALLVQFCHDNNIACDGCITREDYKKAIGCGGRIEETEPPDDGGAEG